MSGPLLLDGCCGGGMAADGYSSVGFEVHGYDAAEQPHYPYPFRVADLRDVLTHAAPEAYDALHLSPPCQEHTPARHLRAAQGGTSRFGDLLTPTLALLRERWGHKVWVVENVDDRGKPPEPMRDPRPGEYLARLCGSSFGLGVRRHRWFLSNVPLRSSVCHHAEQGRPWGVYHVPADQVPNGGRTARNVAHGREVMGVWRPLPWDTLKEGFPPAYTAHVGADLLLALAGREVAA